MKILVLCLSHGYGGLELYVYREIKFLRSSGFTCIPVVSKNSMLEKKLKGDGIDSHILSSVSKHLPVISALKIASLIKKNKIDVVHINWGKDLNLAAMAKYISGKHVKLIYSRHMEITQSKKDLLHRWFYKQINKFLAISRMVENNARAYLPLAKKNIELLYLGVAAPSKKNTNCESFFDHYHIKKRNMNIALFGRIEEGKAQHIMLSALKLLIENNYDVSLTLIGHVMDEGYYSRLSKLVKSYKLVDFVLFTGMIEGVINKMPCFDVVVLTTPKETFGLVLVEAMRGGVAVVGTNAGGVLDIIDDGVNGLLFEANKAESLFNVLSKLYNDPALKQRIAHTGKKKADKMFAEEYHFQQLVGHFTAVCTQNSPT